MELIGTDSLYVVFRIPKASSNLPYIHDIWMHSLANLDSTACSRRGNCPLPDFAQFIPTS